MNDEVNPPARPRRLRLVLALAAVLLFGVALGVVLGVVLDRVFLWAAQRTPDPRLIGEWVTVDSSGSNEEQIVSFHQDGTYDFASFKKADGQVTQTWFTTYQYEWVNRGTIQMYDPFNGWTTRELRIEGDELKLLYDGQVWRLTRKNGSSI
jgi:hypothetical protein